MPAAGILITVRKKETKMGKDTKKSPVVIDGTEYLFEDMTPEQQQMVNHLVDLDRKIGSTQFSLDQLQVGNQAFLTMLKESLAKVEKAEVEVVQ
jgi:restriction endonuclease S subunit